MWASPNDVVPAKADKNEKSASVCLPIFGADDGNRTRVTSLGSWNSAIELHPHY